MFRVFRAEWYDKKLAKLDGSEQKIVCDFEQQLKVEPFSGKPLGFDFFREKKFDGKRILFLVYAEHSVIFLVTITDKKAQQEDIEFIKEHLAVYREFVRTVANKF